MSEPLLFINARLVDCDTDTPGSLLVRDGKIAAVYRGILHPDKSLHPAGAEPGLDSLHPAKCSVPDASFHPAQVEHPDARVIDCGGATLMPAFIDMHAHFRDPGFTHKEDLQSGSRAAAAGGFATVVLMPNTNPVISDRVASLTVRARASGAESPDIFQSVSLTRGFGGTDTSALAELNPAETPIATEDGHEVASAAVMLDAMRACAKTGVLVCCHCEDPSLAERARELRTAALADPDNSAVLYEKTERLLRLAEDTLTYRNLALAEEADCRIHIDHISTIGALTAVRDAKTRRGVVSCEVTPHHLALTADSPEIVNPPLRHEEDRMALIRGLADGTIDTIATDHAPHTREDKQTGAPGFSGIQAAFPVCNTVLVKAGHLTLSALSRLLSANPARLLGLARGRLAEGLDADLVLLDPDKAVTIDPASESWQSRGKNCPYAGKQFHGEILATFRRGQRIF